MARAQVEQGKLRGCPVCGTKVDEAQLRLRDFSWVNEALPGKVGLMDIDGTLSSAKTGKTLMLEMKPPGAQVSVGAKLTFREFVRKGCDVWVVWGPDKDGRVELAHITRSGNLTSRVNLSLHEAAQLVAVWWDQAQDEEEVA
jgi:hypothetical protein